MSEVVMNNIAKIDHEPIAAVADVPAAVPDAFDEGAPVADGNVWGGLLPAAALAAVPAANDDDAEHDDGEPSNDVGTTRKPHRDDANRRLRRIVGPRMVRARVRAGFSQTEAATALGYKNPTQLSLWEYGRRLAPIFEIIKAARLYGTSIDYLTGESHEPDRDPSAGARHAVLRGVRHMLGRVAEMTVSEIDRHQRLLGPHASNVRGLLSAGDALTEAIGEFVRRNEIAFADQPCGAKLLCRAHELETALDDARTAIHLHDALDADLARALAALGDADGLTPEDDEA